MPSFEVVANDGAARLGRLRHARGVLETPALLLYTRRGSPLYLTPDMQHELGSDGQNILLDATQFLGNPAPETLAKAPGKGRGFCALQDKLVVATARDTINFNYPQWRKSQDKAVRVEAFSGSIELSPATYLSTAGVFEPDLLVPLSDEVPAEAKDAHFQQSVARSLRWLDSALEAVKMQEQSAGILAPIQGGISVEQRKRNAAEAAKRSGVCGYAICGLGTGESGAQQRECIGAVVSELPAEGLRLAQGGLHPAALLDAVALGVDCFDATYATQVTSAGYALDFQGASGCVDPARGQDVHKLNMLDAQFREDVGPLVPGCECFTCRHHTRAYLHHLHLVHEMTAQVLLELHNLHQLLLFFRGVRAAVAGGSFDAFRDAFHTRRRLQQPPAVAK